MSTKNRVREIFDDEAFRMLKDFRDWLVCTDSRYSIDVEFVAPLTYVLDQDSLATIVGMNILQPGGDAVRIGVNLLIPVAELPTTTKSLRSGFRTQMRKIKKSMVRQFKELNNGQH